MNYLINGIRGFCMALADSVPGVSGGTIAFILGFYDKFINSLDDLMYGNWKKKKEAVFFLIKIGIGWVIGFILAALVLTSLFESHIYQVSSVFIGFIIFALPIIIKEEKECLKGKYYNLIFLLLGILVVALITYFNPIGGGNVVDVSNLNLGLGLYIFVAGMVAISAMVLPGISGSTLLLIFGLYIPVMNSVKEVIHLNMEYLPVLIIFVLGIIGGVLLVIRLIKIALKKYRSATMYTILGLMIGSIYAIIMGPTTIEAAMPAMSINTFSLLFFIVGGLIIIALEKVKKVLESREIRQ